jgi:protein TonB
MAYAPESPLSTGRLIAISAVVLLHVGLLYVIQEGLNRDRAGLDTGPIKVDMIEELLQEEKEPPPPPPKIETPPPFVPPPDIAIDIPLDAAPATAITATTVRPPPAPPPMAVAPVVRTPPRSDPRRPFTEPEYPPTSRRLGQEGTVVLLIYVLDNGRVGDVKIHKSSGFPKLDEAAEREARRSWRFIPAREGDKPVADWGQFAVTFRLTDE